MAVFGAVGAGRLISALFTGAMKSGANVAFGAAKVGSGVLGAGGSVAKGANSGIGGKVLKGLFYGATFGLPLMSGAQSIQETRQTTYQNALKTPFRQKTLMPATRVFGPGYDTAAVKYNLSQGYQNRGATALQSSTEGLALSLYATRKRGLL